MGRCFGNASFVPVNAGRKHIIKILKPLRMEKKTKVIKSKDVENDFCRFFFKNNESMLKGSTLIAREYNLGSVENMLFREVYESIDPERNSIFGKKVTGRIDFVFKYKGNCYVAEVKYTKNQKDFWDALKVVGYCVLYNWMNESSFKPAIMMRKKDITLTHQMISGVLKITLFGFTQTPDGYTVSMISNKPIWRQ